MPVAWLLGALQRRVHSTVGQKWVISVGLFIATAGFGEYHIILTPGPMWHANTFFSTPVAP